MISESLESCICIVGQSKNGDRRLINSESKFHVELTNYLNPENDYKGDAEVITISCFGEDESKRLLEALETAVFLLKSKLQEKDYGQHEMVGSGFSEIKVQL